MKLTAFSQKLKRSRRLMALAILCWTIKSSGQTNLVLNFNSLPSAQGWFFSELATPIPETAAYSINGNVLHQNTMGSGLVLPGDCVYQIANVVNTNLPFSLQVRARVLQEESIQSDHFGFSISVYGGSANGGYQAAFGLGTNIVEGINANVVYLLDATSYHTYRLDGNFSNGSFQFYIDNVLITTNAGISRLLADGSGLPPFSLWLGDGSGGANAQADISSFSFVQSPLTVAIYPAVEIVWNSATNSQYQVQWASQPNTNLWFNLGGPVAGNGTNNSAFDSTRFGPAKFYRVETLP